MDPASPCLRYSFNLYLWWFCQYHKLQWVSLTSLMFYRSSAPNHHFSAAPHPEHLIGPKLGLLHNQHCSCDMLQLLFHVFHPQNKSPLNIRTGDNPGPFPWQGCWVCGNLRLILLTSFLWQVSRQCRLWEPQSPIRPACKVFDNFFLWNRLIGVEILDNTKPVMECEVFSNCAGLADGWVLRGVTVFWGTRGIGPVPTLRFPFLLFNGWHGKVLEILDIMLKGCIHGTQAY